MRKNYTGPPSGCRKIRPELESRKVLTVFEKLSALSIRDLERFARRGQNIGDLFGENARKAAVEVLIKKNHINEAQLAVKNSLTRLSKLDNKVGELASQALEDFKIAESRKKPISLNSTSIKTFEEFRRINNRKNEPPKNKDKGKGKKR